MRIAAILTASMLLAALAACEPRPIYLYPDGGTPDSDTPDGDAADIDADADADPPCIPPGVPEVCNGLDDDCDGARDNGFNLQEDPSNCGTCGRICALPNALTDCFEGDCRFLDCLPGFADLDPDLPGCEYTCPVYPAVAEDCNGLDDDCDGTTDEPDELPAPPTGVCRTTAGTPCAGTTMICATRGTPSVTTWYCDYAPEVEFDLRVPNGIALDETLCDGHDGDCDGVADEPYIDLGQACDNGLIGGCRDVGVRVCNPLTRLDTVCDLSVLPDPDPLAPREELCNGADDNCDGIVDNFDPADPARVIDDMVHITHSGLDFYIYRYEASRPDATPSSAGASGARPCSRPMVLPWASVTYDDALAACARVGKRLCTATEWQAACAGVEDRVYPYGDTYSPDTCNGVDADGIPGGGDDDVLMATGGMMQCVSSDGLFDLSGNLREWTDDLRGTTAMGDNVYVIRGGEFQTPWPGLSCAFDLSQAAGSVPLPTVGFRCCSDTAP
jgi:hypothetical protein